MVTNEAQVYHVGTISNTKVVEEHKSFNHQIAEIKRVGFSEMVL